MLSQEHNLQMSVCPHSWVSFLFSTTPCFCSDAEITPPTPGKGSLLDVLKIMHDHVSDKWFQTLMFS